MKNTKKKRKCYPNALRNLKHIPYGLQRGWGYEVLKMTKPICSRCVGVISKAKARHDKDDDIAEGVIDWENRYNDTTTN